MPPRARYEERPGRWVAAATLAARGRARAAAASHRGRRCSRATPASAAVLEVRGAQTTGLDGGAWCADGHSDDLPFDQRADDGRSLCFDSPPLDEPLELLGHASRRPHARQRPPARARERAPVRGAAGRRLAARDARAAQPHAPRRARPRRPARPGRARRACASPLDAIGHRFAAGSRLRVALSPTYWPLAWPSPEAVTLGVVTGESSISLPLHDAADGAGRARAVPARGAAGLSDDRARARRRARARSRASSAAAARELRFDWDLGGTNRDEVTGTEITFEADAIFEIVEDDPLSARVVCTNVTAVRREADGWDGRSETRTEMTCDARASTSSRSCACSTAARSRSCAPGRSRCPRDGG